ncbi:hypothetical protein B0T10DRAFT_592516 [Thelonectria olida]|uniref:WSC domain-containing protein n=1 Tax=Thelonectria olida TaxID=1576542 RepID=A0A9P8W9Z9_9HYPO|nr:hypothetical protein B0T10DRAFT_592516 [Thelonectria olida]
MVNYRRSSLGLLTLATSVDAYWRMSCGLIQTGRVDPIINPGKVAGHVHKVSGASNFAVSNTFDNLQSSRCTSCEIQDDKSAYWTPQLYYQHSNGSFEPVPNSGTVVYYLGRGENRSNIEPFPPGFKMLSGDSSARSNDTTKKTYGNSQYSNRPVSDRVSFACLDSSGPMPEDNYMRRTSCDNGMRAQIHFQSCWNGGDYQPDQSHVAYMSQIDNGVCPPTHPRQLPQLFLEVIYGVNDVDKSKGGKFVFSNGDTTGFSFHGDFMNGWNTNVLTAAIKQCINNDTTAGSVSACPPLAQSQTPYFSTNCPERPPIINETVKGMLDSLPGCNPVTSGPDKAPQQACSTQPAINSNSDSGSNSMFNPAVGDKLGNWAYVGCASELSNARTLSKYATASDSMTIDSCTAACKAQGYPLAGVENSRECYCSDALTQGASYMSTSNCASSYKMVCSGNGTQWCGAPNLLTVWNDTSFTPPPALVVGSTKIANGTGTYYGCWSEGSNGRALSSDSTNSGTSMTNEACVAYCQKGGYAYAGTEYSAECYCGNSITSTNITDITQCSMKCSGDKSSYCGAGNRLSVWQVAKAAKSDAPITAVGGTATYLGCFTDGGDGGRTLSNASFAGSTVSVDTCAAFCRQNSYPLFGMEYSSECYCGYQPKTQSRLVSDGDCRMPCAGNSTQICGAGNRISIWNTTLAPAIRVGGTSNKAKQTYMGCWTEGKGALAMSSSKTSDKAMTIDMCSAYCRGKGFAYMGVENGQDCYCNNNGPENGSTKVEETKCNVICKGNQFQNCGGSNKLNVFKVGDAAATSTVPAAQKNAKATTTAKKTTSTIPAAQKNAKPTTTKTSTTVAVIQKNVKPTTTTKKTSSVAVAQKNVKPTTTTSRKIPRRTAAY